LKPAVAAKEIPALWAMLPIPFWLSGSQMLDIALAPTTPAVLETENLVFPSAVLDVNVLRTA
jgi:hypothetical protein